MEMLLTLLAIREGDPHWNENVVILTKFSSLAALEVVILTTSSAASDDNFIKMKTFPFQCIGYQWTTSQRASNVLHDPWKKAVDQTVKLYMIWDTATLMSRYCNGAWAGLWGQFCDLIAI